MNQTNVTFLSFTAVKWCFRDLPLYFHKCTLPWIYHVFGEL